MLRLTGREREALHASVELRHLYGPRLGLRFLGARNVETSRDCLCRDPGRTLPNEEHVRGAILCLLSQAACYTAQPLGILTVQWLLSCSQIHWGLEVPRTYSRLRGSSLNEGLDL